MLNEFKIKKATDYVHSIRFLPPIQVAINDVVNKFSISTIYTNREFSFCFKISKLTITC